MIKFTDNKDNDIFDNEQMKENVSFDVYLTEQIEKIQEAKFRYEKYKKVCISNIERYKRSMNEAENKFNDLESFITENILRELKENSNNGMINPMLFEYKEGYVCYKLPICKIYIKNREIKLIENKYLEFCSWISLNHPDFIKMHEAKKDIDLDDFIKNYLVADEKNNIILKETGEIMNKYFYLTDNDIILKYD